jgi:hypothetical protein
VEAEETRNIFFDDRSCRVQATRENNAGLNEEHKTAAEHTQNNLHGPDASSRKRAEGEKCLFLRDDDVVNSDTIFVPRIARIVVGRFREYTCTHTTHTHTKKRLVCIFSPGCSRRDSSRFVVTLTLMLVLVILSLLERDVTQDACVLDDDGDDDDDDEELREMERRRSGDKKHKHDEATKAL